MVQGLGGYDLLEIKVLKVEVHLYDTSSLNSGSKNVLFSGHIVLGT